MPTSNRFLSPREEILECEEILERTEVADNPRAFFLVGELCEFASAAINQALCSRRKNMIDELKLKRCQLVVKQATEITTVDDYMKTLENEIETLEKDIEISGGEDYEKSAGELVTSLLDLFVAYIA